MPAILSTDGCETGSAAIQGADFEVSRESQPREQRDDSSLTAAPFDAPRPEAARSLERVDAARPEPRGALGDPLVEAYGAAAIDRKW